MCNSGFNMCVFKANKKTWFWVKNPVPSLASVPHSLSCAVLVLEPHEAFNVKCFLMVACHQVMSCE